MVMVRIKVRVTVVVRIRLRVGALCSVCRMQCIYYMHNVYIISACLKTGSSDFSVKVFNGLGMVSCIAVF